MKIWFRVGMEFEVSEDEYRILKSTNIDYGVRESLFTDLLKKAELSGESYAPDMDGLGNRYVNETEDFKEIDFLF